MESIESIKYSPPRVGISSLEIPIFSSASRSIDFPSRLHLPVADQPALNLFIWVEDIADWHIMVKGIDDAGNVFGDITALIP